MNGMDNIVPPTISNITIPFYPKKATKHIMNPTK